jgi:hypothetical protein
MGYRARTISLQNTALRNQEHAMVGPPRNRKGEEPTCVCHEVIINSQRTIKPCGYHASLKLRFR